MQDRKIFHSRVYSMAVRILAEQKIEFLFISQKMESCMSR